MRALTHQLTHRLTHRLTHQLTHQAVLHTHSPRRNDLPPVKIPTLLPPPKLQSNLPPILPDFLQSGPPNLPIRDNLPPNPQRHPLVPTDLLQKLRNPINKPHANRKTINDNPNNRNNRPPNLLKIRARTYQKRPRHSPPRTGRYKGRKRGRRTGELRGRRGFW